VYLEVSGADLVEVSAEAGGDLLGFGAIVLSRIDRDPPSLDFPGVEKMHHADQKGLP
jgi:hypothetical protein